MAAINQPQRAPDPWARLAAALQVGQTLFSIPHDMEKLELMRQQAQSQLEQADLQKQVTQENLTALQRQAKQAQDQSQGIITPFERAMLAKDFDIAQEAGPDTVSLQVRQGEELAPVNFKRRADSKILDSILKTMQINQLAKQQSVPGFNLNENQWKAGNFAARIEQSEQVIDQLMKKGFDPSSFVNSFIGKSDSEIAEALKSQEAKQFMQAMRNYTAAKLRKESGAAISVGEINDVIKTDFPTINDGPDVIEQKARTRKINLEALRSQAGEAYNIIKSRIDDAGGAIVPTASAKNKKSASSGEVEKLSEAELDAILGL